MQNNDCLINTNSFISTLNHLKVQYQLDYKVDSFVRKLAKNDQVPVSTATHYLEELNFSVKQFPKEAIDSLTLTDNELLLCFDHEEDIIILNHRSDYSTRHSGYSADHPMLLIRSDRLRLNQDTTSNEHRDLLWFFKRLTEKDGAYLIITGLITNLLMYVVPIYNMNVFDKVLPHGFMGILSSLVVIAMFLVIIWFINRSALAYLLNDRLFHMECSLTEQFTRRLCNLKPSSIPYSASFMAQLVTYGRSLTQMIGLLHLTALVDFPFMLLSLILVAWFGGIIVLIPLVAIALVVGLNILLQPRTRKYIKNRYEFDGRKRKFEYEIMQSLPFIKMAGMEQYFTDHIQHNRPDHRNYFMISSHVNHISTLILFLSLIGLTALGAYRVSESLMTMGQLVACSLLAAKTISNASITSLLFNINRIKLLFENLNKFYEIPVEHGKALFCLTKMKNLALKDITYSFPQNKYFGLNNINIDLTLPKSLYIYGKPGSGKSTLFSMLAGLSEPKSGHIIVNNLNVEHFDYRDIRTHIHFSSSYYCFFTGTLYDNLTLGRDSITADQVAQALDAMLLSEKINQIDEGLHHFIDNANIVPLSSSERKRFMLARIFLTDADLIVLDEPFEYLSDENSLHMIKAVQTFCKENKKGLLILSNKKSFSRFCDQKLMLNNGQLYPMKIDDAS